MKSRFSLLFIFLTLTFPYCAHAAEWKDRGLVFHAGFRPFLDADIVANGVSEDVWRSAIMGATNFDLPEYRKGLYGAMNFSGTSLYTLYQILGAREPWVMAIQVKKSCLSGAAMFDSDYSIRLKGGGGRFSDWYVKHRIKYKSLEKFCIEEFGEMLSWKEGARYSVSDQDAVTQEETKRCTPVLNDFLDQEKIKLVFDAVNEDSWYIRDRECIGSITGTPDQLLDLLFANQIGDDDNDVLDNLFGDEAKAGSFFAGSTIMVAKILAETSRLDAAHASSFGQLIQKTNSYIGKDTEGKQLSLDRNTDNPFILRHLLLAASGSISAKRTGELQKRLAMRLEELTQVLGNSCQGAHGVSGERRAECSATTSLETKKLIDLLRPFEAKAGH